MAPVVASDPLPDTWFDAYRAELRAAFRPPFPLAAAITFNGAVMAMLWLVLPKNLTGFAFNVHTTWAFPATLASWLLSDNFATNVFAIDRHRMARALSEPHMLRRLLIAKHLALWTIIVPPCITIAVVIGTEVDTTFRTGIGVLLILSMPFAALGVAPLVGVLVPYHPIPLLDRWRRRRELRWRNVRWAVIAYLPYAMIGPLTFAVASPSLLLWHSVDEGSVARPPQWALVVGTAMIVLVTVVVWAVGSLATLRLAVRRRDTLARYLDDPALG